MDQSINWLSDVGGSKTLQKRWTSFLKAQLVCQDRDSGQRYTVLTHAYPLEHRLGDPSSTHFYALFTSQGQGYNTSLEIPDRVLQFAKEHPLLTDTVDAAPLLVRRGTTYTRITATNISNSDAALLHLGTDQGELHSVSIVGRTATLLQEIPLTTSVQPVNNILIHQGHVVVGSPSSLSRVPVEGCRVYPSCQAGLYQLFSRVTLKGKHGHSRDANVGGGSAPDGSKRPGSS
ncbi:unnamed protein product, partial [Coregonus sp. 'balchen']